MLKIAGDHLTEDISENSITINTKYSFRDLLTSKKMFCSIVFLKDADSDLNKKSVLTPLGMSLLEHSVRDTVKCAAPDGFQKFEIGDILYQPEAVGNYTS